MRSGRSLTVVAALVALISFGVVLAVSPVGSSLRRVTDASYAYDASRAVLVNEELPGGLTRPDLRQGQSAPLGSLAAFAHDHPHRDARASARLGRLSICPTSDIWPRLLV